jgi:N-methylhydantoinase B
VTLAPEVLGPGPLDGVQMAVLTHRFQAAVRKMANTLFRTARSGVINSAKDFSCCVLTAEHELLAAAESLPIHVFSGPDLVARYMTQCHPELRPGDAFLHNDPYHGNSHAGDHSLLAPVLDENGAHRFTVYVKAHMADIGNSQPTTLMTTARDVYEEGALIFPCVQVQRDYRDIDDIVRMCRMRIRVSGMWWGDYLGMLGALRIGEREVSALGHELGWETLARYATAWFNYSEARMERAIRALPAGTATVRNAHDPVPGAPDGVRVAVAVSVQPDEAVIEVDLTDSDDCVPSGVNLTEATARTAAMVGVFNSIDHTVPKNAGSFRRLAVRLREGCVAGPARHPSSCSTATTGVADRVSNATQRAMAAIKDGIGMAETASFGPISCAVISGRDPRREGEPFVNMIFFVTGGAGNPYNDGWLTINHVGNAGMMLRDSVEIDEHLYPIRILQNRILPDSAGPGRQRGAAANLVEYEPVECELDVVWSADTSVYPAAGASGGEPGQPHRAYHRLADGALLELGGYGQIRVEAGEGIVSVSASGGGYGAPWERDALRVAHDVSEGWLTAAGAERSYGVKLDVAGAVDRAATQRARARLAAGADAQSLAGIPPLDLVVSPQSPAIGADAESSSEISPSVSSS